MNDLFLGASQGISGKGNSVEILLEEIINMFDERFISFSDAPGSLNLVGVPIVADKADLPGVHIAARNLSADFARVTKGASSPLKLVFNEYDGFKKEAETAIIVGSIETSSLLQSLEKSGRLDFNNIRGKWES